MTKGITMKKYIFSIAVCVGIMTAVNVNTSHAQLLKKLRHKVEKAVDKTSGNKNAGSQAAGSSANSSKSIDFAKYNIATQMLVHFADITEPYKQVQDQYSSYEVTGSTIMAKIIIYAGEKEDGAGDLSGKTEAYVFENGKVVQRTSIDDVEKQKAALDEAYKRYDWPYHYDKDDVNPMTAVGSALGSNAHFVPMGFTESKDKSKFYAIVGMLTDPMEYDLISSDGKKIKLPSAASGLITNMDFSHAAVFGFANTMEENEKKTNNVMQAASNTLNQSDIYFIDGHVIKNAVNIAVGGNVWLDPSGRNYLTADENFGAYINGKKIVDKGPNAGHVWCNANATQWCYYGDAGDNAGHLVFSDGANIPGAIHPVQIVLNGKTYMVWLEYKNGYEEGDLLLCEKTL